ncbi:ATP-dependent Clp protease ATP-binding subunit, partial [Candidatus Uhrbacteria bacterium]|nr:ATP-dependent Clp protease ATP-binding subunit [Candidatus Uhrbacteria bacterium]
RLPIGVDEQLQDLLTGISATSKNILLVGQEGTGKSMLINGIAYAMVGEQVPDRLKDHRLVSISAGHLAASQNPLAVFQALLDELLESGNIVLVIHNMHDFTARRGLTPYDLTEVLAETIERTGLLVIATTTPSAYHSYLENHPLISLFQKTSVEEPDENNTIQILESHIPNLEYRYRVYFTYDAIASVVRLASRYVHERYNPAKSIDVAEQVALSFASRDKKKYTRITPASVSHALEKITHTKVGDVESGERDTLLHLEDKIHERMINQETAVSAVANALRRARVDLREKKRPVSVFLFLGPTGVGKTELAKTLAEVYFGSADAMARLDMSEYQGVSAIERLIGMAGSSARGGALTEPVRKNPFSLLLLDELEKADRDALNLFLQIFEDGRLTDNTGEVIDYTNTIIIATSNAGSQFIQDSVRAGQDADTIKKQLLERELRTHFSPEFLNRFDSVIIFGPLSEEHIVRIARLMIGRVQRQMQEKGITFSLTDSALYELAREGYDPQFGARPMRRVIQQRVEDVLAKVFLQEKIDRRDTVILDAGGVFRIEKGKRFADSVSRTPPQDQKS